VRAIDPPAEIAALPDGKLILARGPFSFEDELALMRAEAIEILVTKNSGGAATYAKIEAARALGVEVVIVNRPRAPDAEAVAKLDDALAWIRAHRDAP
jgi:precorrin-6A/cobalt-precorrin-6A reductase